MEKDLIFEELLRQDRQPAVKVPGKTNPFANNRKHGKRRIVKETNYDEIAARRAKRQSDNKKAKKAAEEARQQVFTRKQEVKEEKPVFPIDKLIYKKYIKPDYHTGAVTPTPKKEKKPQRTVVKLDLTPTTNNNGPPTCKFGKGCWQVKYQQNGQITNVGSKTCTRLHPGETKTLLLKRTIKCKFGANCKYGEKCKFSHAL